MVKLGPQISGFFFFLAVLGLCCCAGFSFIVERRGCSLVLALIVVEWASLVAQTGKNLPAMQVDPERICVLGRSPGGGRDNPLQCSCLENSMDRGA